MNYSMLPTRRIAYFAISMATVVILALVLSATMGVNQAYAVSGNLNSFKGKVALSHYKGDEAIYYFPSVKSGNTYVPTTEEVSDATSSNKKVAKVKIVKSSYYYNLVVTKKGYGKTKITYKCDGKTYNVVLKVYKYKNPLKSLKIGSRQFATYFKKKPATSASKAQKVQSTKGKLVVKAAKGWKAQEILVLCQDTGKCKKVKSSYRIKDNECLRSITMVHKKTGVVENFSF